MDIAIGSYELERDGTQALRDNMAVTDTAYDASTLTGTLNDTFRNQRRQSPS